MMMGFIISSNQMIEYTQNKQSFKINDHHLYTISDDGFDIIFSDKIYDCEQGVTITGNVENSTDLIELVQLTKSLRMEGIIPTKLIIPYINQGNYKDSNSIKYIGNVINNLNIFRVTIIDSYVDYSKYIQNLNVVTKLDLIKKNIELFKNIDNIIVDSDTDYRNYQIIADILNIKIINISEIALDNVDEDAPIINYLIIVNNNNLNSISNIANKLFSLNDYVITLYNTHEQSKFGYLTYLKMYIQHFISTDILFSEHTNQSFLSASSRVKELTSLNILKY